jgi:hypothetical protein
VTVWFRLESLSTSDFRDQPGSPGKTRLKAERLETPNIVWTSLMERLAYLAVSGWYGHDVPGRNSTFKRAWISRLMYQKTFGGQLARDLAGVILMRGRVALVEKVPLFANNSN